MWCRENAWKDLKRSNIVLKCIYPWSISLFCMREIQCVFPEINHPSHVSSPLRCTWSPLNHCFLTSRVDPSNLLWLLEISFDCGAKGKLLTLKDSYIFIKLFYTQTVGTGIGIWRSQIQALIKCWYTLALYS